MADKELTTNEAAKGAADQGLTRRQFLTGVGGLGVGAIFGGMLVRGFFVDEETFAVPVSEGYLLVDAMKCAGCASCMLACSLVHSGECNLSLSRIQVIADPFAAFGEEKSIVQEQCRQCPYPACVEACPTGAMHADAKNGNVRTVTVDKCIGCERCINACPFTPSRVQWNPKDKHAQKCDLCADTPFMTEDGGPGGKQACVSVCPTQAIRFVADVPIQGDEGYRQNLRKDMPAWATLGFPQGDDGEFTATASGGAPAGH